MKKILIFIFSLINVYNFASAGDVIAPLSLYSPDSPYNTGAPYSLVAHGTKNDNFRHTKKDPGTTWMISDLILSDLVSLDKFEMKNSWLEKDKDNLNTFEINLSNTTRTGTWKYLDGELKDSDTNNDFKLYFSIKTSNGKSGSGGWNLFAMNDGWDIDQAVMWSTLNDFFTTDLDDLGGKGISHISFWKGASLPPNENHTPEPATLILLGFGLIGLAGMGRRSRKK